jgi:uncharacterized membrane protein YgcG
VVQVIATVLAAVSSTAALSRLGAAGTIYGAALAAGITVVGNYLYTRWLVRTHEAAKVLAKKATQAIPTIASLGSSHPTERLDPALIDDAGPPDGESVTLSDGEAEAAGGGGSDGAGGSDGSGGSGEDGSGSADSPDDGGGDGDDEDEPDRWIVQRWNRLTARFGFKWVFAGTLAAVFVLILGTVTVVELVAGRSLGQLTGANLDYSHTRLPWLPSVTQRPTPTQTPPSTSPSPTDSATPPDRDEGPEEPDEESTPSETPNQTPEPPPEIPTPDPASSIPEPPDPVIPPPVPAETVTETAPPPDPTATVTVTAPPPSSTPDPTATPDPAPTDTPTPPDPEPTATGEPSESATPNPGDAREEGMPATPTPPTRE